MARWLLPSLCGGLFLIGLVTVVGSEPESAPSQDGPTAERIDVERARQLLRKRQQGEKLTAEEEACLRRAQAAGRAPAGGRLEERLQAAGLDPDRAKKYHQLRQRGEKLTAEEQAYLERAYQALGQRPAPPAVAGATRALYGRDKTGLIPLTEMTAGDRYLGQDGGLYGGGRNAPPEGHLQAAFAARDAIEPLAGDGRPDAEGQIVMVSISMSNATQEFSTFKRRADADPAKSPRLLIVDCAQGGQAMAEWVRADAPPWSIADQRIRAAQATPAQVQIAWIKLANKGPQGSLEEHGRKLAQDTLAVIQNAKAKFPNLRLIYLASRIYGGYTRGALNPEPYAYESAFAARWLIQDQIAGKPELNYNQKRGEVKAAVLLWGPYFWADGVTPRAADKLVWLRDDFSADGTHPSSSGREKVARLLLDFFKTDATSKKWFCKAE